MNIGYHINSRIGDNVVALPSICAIKLIYPQCKLFVWTNAIGTNLFSNIEAIDKIYEISEDLISQINSHSLTYLISSNSNQKTISHLKTSNAKTIITYLKPYNLFDFRVKTAFRSYRIQKNSEKQSLLNLTNLINPNSPISIPQIHNAKLKSNPHNQALIRDFLSPYSPSSPIIVINPFANAARYNLTLKEYATLANKLSKDFLVIIPTFGDKKELILQYLSKDSLCNQKIAIFHNDEDLLNLVALLQKVDLVISPSTGTIHIADNLGIPSIALFSQKDCIAWGGGTYALHHFRSSPKSTPTMPKFNTISA